jgi:membrane protease subunit HflK
MKIFGGAFTGDILAMAGRRSPWGGDNKDGERPSDKGGEAGEAETDDDEPHAPDTPPPPTPPRGPRNPWLPPGDAPPRRSPTIEDIFRMREQGRRGGGSGFPHLPRRPDGKSWVPLIVGTLALIWLGTTSVHMVGPKEEGIVTAFGKYMRTIGPGVSLTLPWPVEAVDVTDVTSIRRDTIPENDSEKLMLTSDQNLVDLSYLIRWNIKNLKDYKYRLDDPAETVKEVGEAAMRATVAEVPLKNVIGGNGRGQIEQSVRERMQAILDAYRAGVLIQGVELKKTDPPQKVVGAFQKVNVAQQEAQRDQSQAHAWAQQLIAVATGEAAAFDKIYAQYKLAPDVTKRRMYYETMERVLRNNDKVILDAKGVTPYLPLPEVQRKAPTDSDNAQQGGQ